MVEGSLYCVSGPERTDKAEWLSEGGLRAQNQMRAGRETNMAAGQMVCWAGQGPRPSVGELSQHLARQRQGPGLRRAEEGAT